MLLMREIISTYGGESSDDEINWSPGMEPKPLRCSEIVLASHSLPTGNSFDGNVISSLIGDVIVLAGILIEFLCYVVISGHSAAR